METITNEVNKRGIYTYLVQETWLEGDCVQHMKHGITFIRHGPTKQEIRRGSGGVGVIVREEATQHWRSQGRRRHNQGRHNRRDH
jgi:hypothetical protein